MAGRGELPFEILRLANALVRELIPVVAPHGLTPQQAAILFRVASLEAPPTLAALGRALSVSKQNVTGMVARLVEAGLLRREGDPADQRASRLTLTRRGQVLTERLAPELERWSDEHLGTTDDRKRAEEVVARLLALLES
ncbi:MAG: MarR family winged helix-turn-helix transcriptional regulator [Thermoanaerobaculia bacterium]